MKNNRHLIIPILIQDMKQEQLIAGLNKLGFQTDVHGSDLCAVVSELMGIPAEKMSWNWCDCYMDYLSQAENYQITSDGKNLIALAESCYNALIICADRDKTNS